MKPAPLLMARLETSTESKQASDPDSRVPSTAHGGSPLVAHVIYKLAAGGMENGLVNLINHTPAERYRHAVICLTDATQFGRRIRNTEVPVFTLNKRPGKDFAAYFRFWKLLRRLQPDIVHSRTWGALDAQVWAALARVGGRVHGEHGYNTFQTETWNRKLIRRGVQLLIARHTTVTRDLARFLVSEYKLQAEKVHCIYNGVDTNRFRPRMGSKRGLPWAELPVDSFVIGTVGRMQPVKDPLTLVHAFIQLLDTVPDGRRRLRLVMAGGGPLMPRVVEALRRAKANDLAWLPGEVDDVPAVLRQMDVFALPSLSEGMSNSILEAMATGLPVIATRVGGNSELVREGETGMLIPPGDPSVLAAAIRCFIDDPNLCSLSGRSARAWVDQHFSIETMVNGYLAVYDAILRRQNPSER